MRHTWKKDEAFVPDDPPNPRKIAKHDCLRCKCIRHTWIAYRYRAYTYARSGIGFGKSRPDCIDWEVENSKTID